MMKTRIQNTIFFSGMIALVSCIAVFHNPLPLDEKDLSVFPKVFAGNYFIYPDSITDKSPGKNYFFNPENSQKILHSFFFNTNAVRITLKNNNQELVYVDFCAIPWKFLPQRGAIDTIMDKTRTHLEWEVIDNNLIKIHQKETTDTVTKDSTYYLSTWRERDVLYSNSLNNETKFTIYSIAGNPQDTSHDGTVVLRKGGHDYFFSKIEKGVNLRYQVSRVSLTKYGLRQTDIHKFDRLDSNSGPLLDSLRKITNFDIIDSNIILNPANSQIEGLFMSPYAFSKLYIRIEPMKKHDEKTWIILIASVIVLLFFLLTSHQKKRIKESSLLKDSTSQ